MSNIENELNKEELELIKGYESLVSEYEDDIEKAHIGFKKLENKLAHEKHPPKDPKAVAAAIGMKKYGKKKFEEAAHKHHAITKSEGVADSVVTPAPEAAIPPVPKLAPGLFQGFTLGSTLVQGPKGNVMANVKAPALDYQKHLDNSTKNQVFTSEQLKELSTVKKSNAKISKEEVLGFCEQIETLHKSMFEEKKSLESTVKWKPSKEELLNTLSYQLKSLQDLKCTSWTVEQEVPEAKELAEKAFSNLKKQIMETLKKYKSAKDK